MANFETFHCNKKLSLNLFVLKSGQPFRVFVLLLRILCSKMDIIHIGICIIIAFHNGRNDQKCYLRESFLWVENLEMRICSFQFIGMEVPSQIHTFIISKDDQNVTRVKVIFMSRKFKNVHLVFLIYWKERLPSRKSTQVWCESCRKLITFVICHFQFQNRIHFTILF